ncbi:hypothetical protein D1007_24170 [Hordeum vulgare]|nr:hypothetical protein D1007_24170 [Hordeum vulgare]
MCSALRAEREKTKVGVRGNISLLPLILSSKSEDMAVRQISWTPTMSSYILAHLCGLVTGGHRTLTYFKNVHLNGCAATMNEHFQRAYLIGTRITDHIRTWKRNYKEIVHLKSLSGEPFLNKLIKHYEETMIIIGESMATRQYAKGSSDSLVIEVIYVEE